ncbi:mechanosensitive ion channel family protein [Rappaport israeli]|uniref:mechanosensitive ion channel family protein n=1 Tax=Rappaport israeli TaxID=1839807 RepID=UPI002FCE0926
MGIVIGFAFRDIAENFLASLLLSLRRPFTRGDLIKVADKLGIVQSMNTRTTVLLSSEGNLIQIPNSMVFKNIIHNYTASSSQRDIIDLGIGYDASISDTQSIILDLLSEHEALMQDPKPLVLVDNLGAATVNLKIYYWFDGKTLDRLKLRSSILRLLKRRLMEEGISLPDDAREIIFPNGVPVYLQNQSNLETPTISTTSTLASHEPAKEVSSTVTASEGNLTNERQEIEATAEVDLNQDCKNLLSNP